MLRLLPIGLALLRAVDTAESDAFRTLVVQDFDGATIEDGDDWAGEVFSKDESAGAIEASK